ncbi:MAG: putative toxin-antitoxin system toxin component, PIN family [Candidatus Cloacimonetes bacterium]|nr:putative toxin-antitoxin system toxin component, PIN family [Candidatus Cloacimonadota bacterium]
MRIIVDSNIIISAGLFPDSNIGKVLIHIVDNHNLVLCKYTLDELESVFIKKFPDKLQYFRIFINEFKFELLDLEINDFTKYPQIRDVSDAPLLAYAIEGKTDILLTGDKDFENVLLVKPKIMTPRMYIDEIIKKT